MPFTPFHFGPGIFFKSLSPGYFSFVAFAATQVVIDCETLYFMLRRDYPVHRALHTFVGATLAGLATAVLLIGCGRVLRRSSAVIFDPSQERRPFLRSESSTIGILIGGIIGGVSHPFFDGIMHPDIRPFAPWSENNPLLTMIGIGTLHLGCMLSAMIGLSVLAILVFREKKPGGSMGVGCR